MMLPDRLTDQLHDVLSGVQRRERILEDDLHIRAKLAHLTIFVFGDILAVEDDLSAGRFDELEDRSAGRGLSAAGFTDDPQGRSAFDAETYIVYRVKFPFRRVKIFGKVLYLKDHIIFHLGSS